MSIAMFVLGIIVLAINVLRMVFTVTVNDNQHKASITAIALAILAIINFFI